MTREEYIDFANALKNNYTIDFDKLPEFCDMAISTLSTDGEYIKKADILNELGDVNMDILTDEVKEIVNGLPTYSFPDSAENKGDLISRQAVLNEIAEWIADGYADSVADCSHISSLVSHLPSVENKGEWIPVSKRLPEEDREVLIFTKDKEINKAYHTLKEWSDTQWEWFVFGTLGYSLTYSDDEVLAWQPLPEPYKAEKGGE